MKKPFFKAARGARNMNDKEIIRLFFDRDEKAIEYTAEKYHSYCRAIADKILGNAEDDEECLNDVWLAAWNTIPPNDPPSLATYLGRITRNISVQTLRRINRKKRGKELTVYLEELGEALPSDAGVEDALEEAETQRLLAGFVSRQSKLNRSIFICRYYYLDSITEIAARYDLTQNQVKLRLHRMRKKLRDYLEKEGMA